MRVDLLVIGAGSAGMAAAVAAHKEGIARILLVERTSRPGGVLPQCIHDGFGLMEFGSSLTGPEYAARWEEALRQEDITLWLDATVLEITGSSPFRVRLADPVRGLSTITAKSIILATGCRERALGQLRVPGSRPAGIYTAGAAQYMMNQQNYLPGRSAVILGSGDIGLIMARRLTLEGIRVKLILGEKASGLIRNYIQCIRDFDLPIRFGFTVLSVHGYRRLKGITIAPVDKAGRPDLARKQYIPCDTLLIAAGLIPETELWKGLGRPLSETAGIPVEQEVRTDCGGLFACGNVVRIYDTADEVSACGRRAGEAAACWLKKQTWEPRAAKTGMPPGKRLEEGSLEQSAQLLLCTVCPNGCTLRVEETEKALRISGNLCGQGEQFARRELAAPERMLTTTVRVQNGTGPLVPVKTAQAIPKSQLAQAMRACASVNPEAPVALGSVLIEDIVGTGVSLVATSDMPRREGSE